ncbi:MAG: GNAT family N-acetyltransferase [candidate division KSB1 bacterium]|nr:GNAT family N-acetyltransferase [candidate division KSB1 bacterium]
MKNKENYREFCRNNPAVRLFSQPWWLDAAAGAENWDVALVMRNNQVAAALPFSRRRLAGFQVYKMPELTPWYHIYIDYPPEQKMTRRLSFEKDILSELIEQLPPSPRFMQKYSYELTNWLPFYWKGYKQTTRYSYIIPDISDTDAVYKGFRNNIRREIRKAERRLEIRPEKNLQEFYRLNKMTFSRQNETPSYSFDLLKRVDDACERRECRKIWAAVDDEGRKHAVLYLAWDAFSAYYLMGGADPELRNSGASSLLMWTAIQFASKVTAQFDFEGSMIEPIERFVRGFGARQTPYFVIHKKKFPFTLI